MLYIYTDLNEVVVNAKSPDTSRIHFENADTSHIHFEGEDDDNLSQAEKGMTILVIRFVIFTLEKML